MRRKREYVERSMEILGFGDYFIIEIVLDHYETVQRCI